jgi:hypothetical protein
MRKEEIEYNIKQYVCKLIDDILPQDSLIGKIENRTAKYWVEQNQWRLDRILSSLGDENGCIDPNQLVEQYKDVLFENGELRLSIKEIVPSVYKDIVPDKIVLFTMDDLYHLVGI